MESDNLTEKIDNCIDDNNSRYSSYFVRLKHAQPDLTVSFDHNGRSLTGSLKKIEDDFYTLHFKKQYSLKYKEILPFKNKNNSIEILYPYTSKFNKRKLNKICKILTQAEVKNHMELILEFLKPEKYLSISKLTDFFDIDPEETLIFLNKNERDKTVKIIDISSMLITSYSNYENLREKTGSIFDSFYSSRNKHLTLTELESSLNIPKTSIFFRYLMQSWIEKFPFKINGDKVVFQEILLSEKEENSISEIEKILKRLRLTVFTLKNLIDNSDLSYREVNNSVWTMIDNDITEQMDQQFFIQKEDLTKIINRLKKYKRNESDTFDIQTFREMTNLNRNQIILILEYLDKKGITVRIDNKRKIIIPV